MDWTHMKKNVKLLLQRFLIHFKCLHFQLFRIVRTHSTLDVAEPLNFPLVFLRFQFFRHFKVNKGLP